MLLDDGTRWTAEPVTEAEALRRSALGGRGAELWRSLLSLELRSAQDLALPELARGFSGYGVDRFRCNGMINPLALVCGAEGTLGIITEATLALSPLVDQTVLLVAGYDTFADALDDAVELRSTGPIAIESFDETTLQSARSSPAWPAIGDLLGGHSGALLMVEYDAALIPNQSAVIEVLTSTGRSCAQGVITDSAAQSRAWKVRSDAVGLLAKKAVGGPELSARPVAFVEDCAVPVDKISAFIAAFRRLLDDAGLTYAMFGHADVGCVHVRPALDLTDPDQREIIAAMTSDVVDLVARFGGILWGEHGRGFRGYPADRLLPAKTVTLMRQIKTAFDPNDTFNPGKLYRPVGSNEPILEVGDPTLRGAFDAEVPVTVRSEFDTAFACNGNALCQHYGSQEVMCPSYKATGDPALSPKGRVDLLRTWLCDRELVGASSGGASLGSLEVAELEDGLARNLDQCLSCSACGGRCPVSVDVTELKSQFLEAYYRTHRRPLSHHVLSRFEKLVGLAARAPRLATLGLAAVERLFGLVDLAGPDSCDTIRPTPFEGQPGFDVVILGDVFTATLEPSILARAILVLEGLGISTAVAKFVECGKFDHVNGRRDRFAAAVSHQTALVQQVVEAGSRPVVIEPAVATLHANEYPRFDPSYPTGALASLGQVLVEQRHQLSDFVGGTRVRLLGHCTERSIAPASAHTWVTALEAAGYQVQAPEVGCCGMAGLFGHSSTNLDMSRQIWNLSWAKHLEQCQSEGSIVAATGYSCRSQALRFAGAKLVHPIELFC